MLPLKRQLRVRETFYASGVPVRAGQIVMATSISEDVNPDERMYRLLICLQPLDPPGDTILWDRTQPLGADYVRKLFEEV